MGNASDLVLVTTYCGGGSWMCFWESRITESLWKISKEVCQIFHRCRQDRWDGVSVKRKGWGGRKNEGDPPRGVCAPTLQQIFIFHKRPNPISEKNIF